MGKYHATVVSLLVNKVSLPIEWENVIETQRETILNERIAQRNGLGLRTLGLAPRVLGVVPRVLGVVMLPGA